MNLQSILSIIVWSIIVLLGLASILLIGWAGDENKTRVLARIARFSAGAVLAILDKTIWDNKSSPEIVVGWSSLVILGILSQILLLSGAHDIERRSGKLYFLGGIVSIGLSLLLAMQWLGINSTVGWIVFAILCFICLEFIFYTITLVKKKIEKIIRLRKQKDIPVFDLGDARQALKEVGITQDRDLNRILSGEKYKTAKELRDQINLIISGISALEQITDIPGFKVTSETKTEIARTFLLHNDWPFEKILTFTRDMFGIFKGITDMDQADWLIRESNMLLSEGHSNPTSAGINKAGEKLIFLNDISGAAYGEKKSLALLSDGKILAIPTGEGVKLFNVESGEYLRSICDKISGQTIKISGNGERIALYTGTAIYIYHVNTDKEVARYDSSKYLYDFALTPDGKSLITYHPSDSLIVKNIDSGTQIQTRDIRYVDHMQSLTNDRIVVCHGTLNDRKYEIYNYKTRMIEKTLVYPVPKSHEFLGNSQEGTKIVIYNSDKIQIIDADNVDNIEIVWAPLETSYYGNYSTGYICAVSSKKVFVFGGAGGGISCYKFTNLLELMPNKNLKH